MKTGGAVTDEEIMYESEKIKLVFLTHGEGPTEPHDHMIHPAISSASGGTSAPVTAATLSLCLAVGLGSCVCVCVCVRAHVRERSPSPRQDTGSNWYGLLRRGNTFSSLEDFMLIFSHIYLYSLNLMISAFLFHA